MTCQLVETINCGGKENEPLMDPQFSKLYFDIRKFHIDKEKLFISYKKGIFGYIAYIRIFFTQM